MDHTYYRRTESKHRCCVPNCKDKTSKRHRFPKKDPSLFKQWVANVCNPKLNNLSVDEIYNSYIVCEQHFLSEYVVPGTKRGLSAIAVPTLFPPKEISVAEPTETAGACMSLKGGTVQQEPVEKIDLTQDEEVVELPAPTPTPARIFLLPIVTGQRPMYLQANVLENPTKDTKSGATVTNVLQKNTQGTKSSPILMNVLQNSPQETETDPVVINQTQEKKIEPTEKVAPPNGNLKVASTFSHVCKLCLKNGKLRNIKRLKCAFTTTVIGVVEVFLESKIPDNICVACFKELENIAIFIRQCKHSQFVLNQIKTGCDKLVSKKDTQIETVKKKPSKILNNENLDVKPVKAPNTKASKEVEDTENITPVEAPPPEPKIKKCNKCGEEVTRMMDHYKTHKHCRPKTKCPHCDKMFLNKMLKSHILGVHSQSSFMCHICSKMFKYEVNLSRHLKNHYMPKRFMCEFCGKGYSTKIQLDDHLNKHTGLKPHACAYCDRKFSLRSVRKIHEDRHLKPVLTSTESQVCELCNITFANERALKIHNTVHKERFYECHICKTMLNSKRQFDVHLMNVHNIEKPFYCVCCSKTFRLQSSLISHMRIHTGERPYSCPECPKRFVQQTHLKYHMMYHRGIKSYQCTFCEKTFTLKGNLTVHLRLHTGERPYVCHVCKAGFRDASMRKRHVLKTHGIEQVRLIGAGTHCGENCE